MNAISIDGLRKTYPRSWASGPVEAIKEVSLSVAQGEVFGFIGPNGAGKSTAIKILTGAMRPTAGNVSLFGIPVNRCEARRSMGYVPENPSLPDYLTPLEILLMALDIHGLRLADGKAHCMRWLERFELDHVANKSIRTFSKGMAQRTALAHALAVKPRLLILDEPLSGLDPVGRRDVVDILAEYKRGGGTIFLTSHVLHDVERLADRFGLIHKGVLMTIDSPTELVSNEPMYTVRSVGDSALEGMRAEASGRWSAEVASGELWSLLQRLKDGGHRLVEVKPSLTLETAFLRYLGVEQRTDGRRPH